MSSCMLFVPDDTARTGLSAPLMLCPAAGEPVLARLLRDLQESGVRRVLLVCREGWLDQARACVPESLELRLCGADEAADQLHVFLSTDEEDAPELLLIPGPAYCDPEASADEATAALFLDRAALMEALDQDFSFAEFLRTGRRADEELHLHALSDTAHLADYQASLRRQAAQLLRLAGVSIAPDCVVDPGVHVGAGTEILPGCVLTGTTRVGAACRIGPQSVLENTVVGDGVEVRMSNLVSARVGARAKLGPWTSAEHAEVGEDAVLEAFTLLQESSVAPGVRLGSGNHITGGRTISEDLPDPTSGKKRK
ncbi:MAG: hypothetical protein IKS29_04395 [Oscillospiraceae bacterium]|nr:hypothetical protein [Oscillospiraceae bacterium]